MSTATTTRTATRTGAASTEPALLYSVPDAAKLLGIGRSQLYELMTAGRVQYVKLGTRRLIPRAVLLAFVEELMSASWSSDE
ncbi:MAG: helix-turn-helix domain-containing protein [Actinomycetota bacterium]